MKQSERPSYKAWYAKNRERIIRKAVVRNRKRGEERRAYQRAWYARNKERLKTKKATEVRASYRRHATQRAATAKAKRAALRAEFIEAYGGECACCGITNPVFLTLEHRNRDGSAHRKEFSTSHGILADLKKRGWPQGDYELLCFNCNRASWALGVCPHRQKAA